MAEADEPFEQVWRHSPITIVVVAILAVGFAVLASIESVAGAAALAFMLWLWAVINVIGCWRFARVPYIAATESGVVVQNAFLHYKLAWSEIADIRGGYYGLRIVRTDGTSVTASAVQQPNIARWAGWRTRSDDVAGELMNRRLVHMRHTAHVED